MGLENGSGGFLNSSVAASGTAFVQWSTHDAHRLVVYNTTGSSIEVGQDIDATNSGSKDTWILPNVTGGLSMQIRGITNTNQIWWRISGAANAAQKLYGRWERNLD